MSIVHTIECALLAGRAARIVAGIPTRVDEPAINSRSLADALGVSS